MFLTKWSSWRPAASVSFMIGKSFFPIIFINRAKNVIDLWRMLLNFRESIENETKDEDEINLFSQKVELKMKTIQNPAAVQFMISFLNKIKFPETFMQ